MLKKLGTRLTLLNLLVSGAILVAMALAALGVAESALVRFNEKELTEYTASIATALAGNRLEDEDIFLQVPLKYRIVLKEDTQAAKILNAQEEDTLTPDEYIEPFAALDLEGDGQGVRIVNISAMNVQEAGANAVYVVTQGMATADVDGTGYRVIASRTVGDNLPETRMFVLQDRTDEFRERDRLRLIFLGCVLGGLFLIFPASLFLSGRAIEPVEKSIKSQREFVAAASHELRTPITAVRANAEVLLDAELDEYRPYLQSILTESERMTRLVGDLLSLARADAGQAEVSFAPVDAAETMREVFETMKPLCEKAGLSFDLDAKPALILADPDRLRQALVALVDNAIRYTPPGGGIVLSVKKAAHSAMLCVADTGIGIPDEHKERVFERFYRVDAARVRAQGGAGLGLSIVKEYVERMRGEVAIEDAPGGGSVFTLKFPLA